MICVQKPPMFLTMAVSVTCMESDFQFGAVDRAKVKECKGACVACTSQEGRRRTGELGNPRLRVANSGGFQKNPSASCSPCRALSRLHTTQPPTTAPELSHHGALSAKPRTMHPHRTSGDTTYPSRSPNGGSRCSCEVLSLLCFVRIIIMHE